MTRNRDSLTSEQLTMIRRRIEAVGTIIAVSVVVVALVRHWLPFWPHTHCRDASRQVENERSLDAIGRSNLAVHVFA
jgi:hypothetical protein